MHKQAISTLVIEFLNRTKTSNSACFLIILKINVSSWIHSWVVLETKLKKKKDIYMTVHTTSFQLYLPGDFAFCHGKAKCQRPDIPKFWMFGLFFVLSLNWLLKEEVSLWFWFQKAKTKIGDGQKVYSQTCESSCLTEAVSDHTG